MSASHRLALPAPTRRLNRLLAACCLILIVALPPAEALFWGFADAGILAVHANLAPQDIGAQLQTWQRLAAATLMELPLCLLLVGVWYARQCFSLFGAGKVFTPAAIRHLRRLAGWSIASAIANILCHMAVSVVLSLPNEPGRRMLAIGVGSDQLLLLFFAALVWVMAAIIGEGLEIADENASFV